MHLFRLAIQLFYYKKYRLVSDDKFVLCRGKG